MKRLKKEKMASPPVWEAFIVYDRTTGQRLGLYGSQREAEDDCPGWEDEDYVISPCQIRLIEKLSR